LAAGAAAAAAAPEKARCKKYGDDLTAKARDVDDEVARAKARALC